MKKTSSWATACTVDLLLLIALSTPSTALGREGSELPQSWAQEALATVQRVISRLRSSEALPVTVPWVHEPASAEPGGLGVSKQDDLTCGEDEDCGSSRFWYEIDPNG